MKNIIKKNKWLYSFLKNIKHKLLIPLKQGKVSFYIKYYFTTRNAEVNKLKSYGLTNISPFNYADWRNGKGRDHAFRRYYLAEYDETKVFVKIGIDDATVANEYCVMKHLQDEKLAFVAPMLCGSDKFDLNTTMLAVEFIPDLTRFSISKNRGNFEKMCKQFCTMITELSKCSIIHADIHAGNLMLQNDKIYLLDFGISKVNGIDNGIDYSNRPGTFYRTFVNKRRYDDAYSFIQLVDRLGIVEEWKECEPYKKILAIVDSNYFEVTI